MCILTRRLASKFSTDNTEIVTIQGDQEVAPNCYIMSMWIIPDSQEAKEIRKSIRGLMMWIYA